jgi:hypothetical protein
LFDLPITELGIDKAAMLIDDDVVAEAGQLRLKSYCWQAEFFQRIDLLVERDAGNEERRGYCQP